MKTNNKIREEWEEEFDEILNNTIIEGGYDYDKEDSWLDYDEAEERIKSFISELLKSQREEKLEKIKTRYTKWWQEAGSCNKSDVDDLMFDIEQLLSNLSPNKENKNNE